MPSIAFQIVLPNQKCSSGCKAAHAPSPLLCASRRAEGQWKAHLDLVWSGGRRARLAMSKLLHHLPLRGDGNDDQPRPVLPLPPAESVLLDGPAPGVQVHYPLTVYVYLLVALQLQRGLRRLEG